MNQYFQDELKYFKIIIGGLSKAVRYFESKIRMTEANARINQGEILRDDDHFVVTVSMMFKEFI